MSRRYQRIDRDRLRINPEGVQEYQCHDCQEWKIRSDQYRSVKAGGKVTFAVRCIPCREAYAIPGKRGTNVVIPPTGMECQGCHRNLPASAFTLYSRSYTACNECRFLVAALRRKRMDAARAGLDFNLTLDSFERPLPAVCPISLQPLLYSVDGVSGIDRSRVASFDRVIPSLGYVEGNVQIISHRANGFKSNASRDEIERLLRYMDEKSPI